MIVESIKSVDENTFVSDVIEKSKEKIIIVDFWAPWCGPCKALTPILESQATKKREHLEVVKVNIDENQGTPPKYGIRGIPTLMILKEGNIEATKVGALSKSQLTAFIDSNI